MYYNFNLNDKQILGEALSFQKNITKDYNDSANECVDSSIKDELINILIEEQQIESEIISEMTKRGWHSSGMASEKDITKTKEKYKEILKKM